MAEQTITRTFALDEETAKRLEGLATNDDRSQSYIVRQLINQEYARRNPRQTPSTEQAEPATARQ